MKRLLIILIIIMMVLSGCTPFDTSNEKGNVSTAYEEDSVFDLAKPFTLAQVTTAMMLGGLPFCENRNENPEDYVINGVRPAIYTIQQNRNILMVYIFDSIALRNEACSDTYGLGYWVADELPQKENWLTASYTAKNALIVDRFYIEAYTSNINFVKALTPLKAAIDSLNGAKEMLFAGKSNHWDARLIIKYYQYWYEDNRGAIHICQQSNEKWQVKYLAPNPESIQDLKYKYTALGGSGSGNAHGSGILHNDGRDYYLPLFGSQSNKIPDKDDHNTLTIEWEGNKETLQLKMID